MIDPLTDWEAVYWEQAPRLYNYFRYRTGDGDIAQDLTAQTMTRAWRYRTRYEQNLGAFEAWLFQIARNVLNDFFRQESKACYVPLENAEKIAAPISIEREVEKRQDADRLYTLLDTLPPREQELIALKYGAGLTNRRIAQITELSESNIGTILHRVIQKLRLEWEDEL